MGKDVLQRLKKWCITLMKETHWGDILTFLFFVLLATALWYGHALQSVRNATIPVIVSYAGIPENVGIEKNRLPDTLLVDVRDAGYRLHTYRTERPQLTIDLSNQIHGDKGTIRISSDVIRRSITDILQGTSKLQSVTPEQIVCNYYRQDERLLPIEWDGSVQPAREYYMAGDPKLSPEYVKVYGRKDVLDTIRVIHSEWVALSELKDTTVARVALQVPKGPRRCASLGRNSCAMAECTKQTSSALHTLGRLVLAFSTMFSAMFRSADFSTYTWQMPVPVAMQGTVAVLTQALISPAPPRGISRSI